MRNRRPHRLRRNCSGKVVPLSGRRNADADAAAERMKRIPAFVRGMVVRAVEETCRKNGLDRVTVEELERIRARMPTPKFFG
ncbi:MAG TPA: PCP reductase family protein [Vicinamibacterales bacterium]|nr:PCP reductase family protein [Vicinamibacterales bacterium]